VLSVSRSTAADAACRLAVEVVVGSAPARGEYQAATDGLVQRCLVHDTTTVPLCEFGPCHATERLPDAPPTGASSAMAFYGGRSGGIASLERDAFGSSQPGGVFDLGKRAFGH